MPGEHVFVDETKRRGYVVVAVVVEARKVATARAAMRGLLIGSQSHLHFTKERDGRRREIVRAVLGSGIVVDVLDASSLPPREARRSALERLVSDLAGAGAARLVVEQDDSLVRQDRRVLAAAVGKHGIADRFGYEHLGKREEPLLWAADAAAWCWTHREWRPRIHPVVRTVTTLG